MTPITEIGFKHLHTHAQVRTQNGMDRESIRELADSIKANGLLQPLLVRQDPSSEFHYIVVAGHRRLKAMEMLKVTNVPCVVTTLEEGTSASTAQLVENLQRVDLSLLDTATAVRALADDLGDNATLCSRIGKSKSWVSKHLAITDPKFSAMARELVERRSVTDLEIAHAYNQIEKSKSGKAASILQTFEFEVASGRMTRAMAKGMVSLAKPQAVAQDAEGQLELDRDEDSEVTTAPMKAPAIKLTPEHYAIFEEKGGMRWLIDLLTA